MMCRVDVLSTCFQHLSQVTSQQQSQLVGERVGASNNGNTERVMDLSYMINVSVTLVHDSSKVSPAFPVCMMPVVVHASLCRADDDFHRTTTGEKCIFRNIYAK